MCNDNGYGRVFDETIELKDNAMLKIAPHLWDEWDFVKNDEIGLDIYKVTKGSNKAVWWICDKCKSSYDLSPNRRTKNRNCPYCHGTRVNYTNSLATLNPELASEWHPTKNGELTPHDVTSKSSRVRAWWLGECGHEWEANLSNRNGKNSKCPVCNNKEVVIGFNDMWTTNPELASLLADPEDGYKYTKGSNHITNWRCPDCKEEIENKKITKVNKYGVSCVNCSDGFSFPEKMMYHILKQLNVDFETQRTFIWSDSKRYDFYIPSLGVIETHGAQHLKESGFSSVGGKTLKEEQRNDAYKRELALKNGIKHYVEINCSYSNFEYIKNNILSSELISFFDFTHVDWDAVNLNTQKSVNFEILKFWNDRGLSVKEISEITKLNRVTISKVLKNYCRLGMCEYSPNRGMVKYQKQFSERKIHQFDKELNLIKVWVGLNSIEDELGYNRSSIVRCCKGRSNTSHGYVWKYEEDVMKPA